MMRSNFREAALPRLSVTIQARSAKLAQVETQARLNCWSISSRFSFTVTKKRPKCAYCKVRFKPPARGRTPTYCSRSHRQRAYEQRRLRRAEGRRMPIKLLRTDIATLLAQRDFRDKVIAVLREVGLLLPKPGPDKRDLRLVDPPNPSD
jgi:hypothetical protein